MQHDQLRLVWSFAHLALSPCASSSKKPPCAKASPAMATMLRVCVTG